jgi:hypothetical protein
MEFNHTITVGIEGKPAYASLDENGAVDELKDTNQLTPEEILALMQEVIKVKGLLYKKQSVTKKKK